MRFKFAWQYSLGLARVVNDAIQTTLRDFGLERVPSNTQRIYAG